MIPLLLSETTLLVPCAGDWKVIENSSLESIVSVLQAGFPAGTEFLLVWDSVHLQARSLELPGKLPSRELRSLLADEVPESNRPGIAITAPIFPPGSSDEGGALVWLESSPFVKILSDLLRGRNRQYLAAALPWVQVFGLTDSEAGRATLCVSALPGFWLVTGRDSDGRVVRLRIERNAGRENGSELVAAINRSGANHPGARGLPARIEIQRFPGVAAEMLPEREEKQLRGSNYLEMRVLAPAGVAKVAGRVDPRASLVDRPWSSRLRGASGVVGIAAVLAFGAAAVFHWVRVRPLGEQVAAMRMECQGLERESAKLSGIERQLQHLDSLYAADAGWKGGLPPTLLENLDAVFPRECSLEELTVEEDGRLMARARWWTPGNEARTGTLLDQVERNAPRLGVAGRLERPLFDKGTNELSIKAGL